MNYNDMFESFMAPLLSEMFDEDVTIVTTNGTYNVSGMPLLNEFDERRSDNIYDVDLADIVLRIRKTDIPTESIDTLRRSSFTHKTIKYTVIKIDDDGVYFRCHLKAQETKDIRDRGRRSY